MSNVQTRLFDTFPLFLKSRLRREVERLFTCCRITTGATFARLLKSIILMLQQQKSNYGTPSLIRPTGKHPYVARWEIEIRASLDLSKARVVVLRH